MNTKILVPGSKEHIDLWSAINEYVISCDGDPGRLVQGNVFRQNCVVEIERCVQNIINKTTK